MNPIARLGIAAVICLGLAVGIRASAQFGAQASAPLAGSAPHSFPAGSIRLYRVPDDMTGLQGLDMHSLANVPARGLGTDLIANPKQNAEVVASPDGSTYAVVDELPSRQYPVRPQDMTMQLFDARTGAPLSSRHHPAAAVWVLGLSAGGSVAYGYWADTPAIASCAANTFYLLNTRTGRVIRRVTVDARLWDPVFVGPNLQRLYTVTDVYGSNQCGPQPTRTPTVTAYDLRTGSRVASVRLGWVFAGQWPTKRTINTQTIDADWVPGVALSPDGSQLSVLDGHNDMLTVLDARTLRVAAREDLSMPQSPLQSLASALGFTPDTAEAKGELSGIDLQMQYTADGRSLLVTGSRLLPDSKHLYSSAQYLGIRLIDVASGRIRAWDHDSRQLVSIWAAPDGSAVYASFSQWSRVKGWMAVLERLDPSTLRVLTQRMFLHTNWLNLVFLQGATQSSKPVVAPRLGFAPRNCPHADPALVHGGKPPQYNLWVGARALVGYSGWYWDGKELVLPFGNRTPYGYPQKIFWQLAKGVHRTVTLRGWNLRTGQAIWFGRPRPEAHPKPLVPPPVIAWPEGLVRDHFVNNASAPTLTFVPAAGCYAIQAHWKTGSWTIRFAAGCGGSDCSV